MRMIAGLEQETTGEIYINDNKVNEMEPKDRRCDGLSILWLISQYECL